VIASFLQNIIALSDNVCTNNAVPTAAYKQVIFLAAGGMERAQ